MDEPGKAPEPVAAEAPRRSTGQSPPRERGPRLPEHLPVIEEVIVPEPVKAAPQAVARIGEEVSERLDYEPARFLRRRTVRRSMCSAGSWMPCPSWPRCPTRSWNAASWRRGSSRKSSSPSIATIFRSTGRSRSTGRATKSGCHGKRWPNGSNWPRSGSSPSIGRSTKASGRGYVQVDETPIRYLAPGHGKTKLGYLWTCGAPRGDVIFHWATSRAATCLENIIPVDFRGTLQCDGYEAYDCFARRRGEKIVLAGCLAHVRRKFYDARETAPKVAGWFLKHFQNLYALEAKLRNARAGPKLRQAERASLSRPVLARVHRALVRLKTRRRFLPRSLMGKAIDYALKQWPALLLFLEDGRLEIDNNRIENAIRPTAIGKKNWLFIGEAQAGQRSAIIYTVIECCRRRGLDPFAYLREVFTRLPSMTNWQVKDITPEAWAKSAAARVDLRATA
jgi:transposase